MCLVVTSSWAYSPGNGSWCRWDNWRAQGRYRKCLVDRVRPTTTLYTPTPWTHGLSFEHCGPISACTLPHKHPSQALVSRSNNVVRDHPTTALAWIDQHGLAPVGNMGQWCFARKGQRLACCEGLPLPSEQSEGAKQASRHRGYVRRGQFVGHTKHCGGGGTIRLFAPYTSWCVCQTARSPHRAHLQSWF